MYPSKYILTKYFFTTFSVMPIKTNHIFTFSEENVFIHAKLLVTISFYYSILSRPPVENHESVLLNYCIFFWWWHRCRSLFRAWASLSLSLTHTQSRWFLTHAPLSVGPARHPRRTDAHEGADLVFAGHSSGGAVVQPVRALVLVCREREREREE